VSGHQARPHSEEKAKYYNKIPLKKRLLMIETLNHLIYKNNNQLQAICGTIIRITLTDTLTLRAVFIDFMNEDTGLCIPKQQTIADKIGKTREAVNKSIQKWVKLGVLGTIARYRYQKTQNQHSECEAPKRVASLYFIKGNLLSRISDAIKNKLNRLENIFKEKVKTILFKTNTIIKKFYDGTSESRNINVRDMILERETVIRRQQESEKQRLHNARYGESRKIFIEQQQQKKSDAVYQTPQEVKPPEKSSNLDSSFALLYETLFGQK
jgi:hypothetical protein